MVRFIRQSIAVSLYKRKTVPLRTCASLAGMPTEDFIKFLGEKQISIFQYEEGEELVWEDIEKS